GAYSSPAILLRSGVGPAGQLRPLGLPVHEDLRGVGRNLHDHPLLRLPFAADGEPADPPHQTLVTAHGDAHTAAPDLQVFPAGPASTDAETTLTLLVGLLQPRAGRHLRPDV